MSDITIREAEHKDRSTLARFLQGIIAAERHMDECLKDEYIEYYDPEDFIKNDNASMLIASLDDVPIACGAGVIKPSKDYYKHDEHLYLAMMYVEPQHRGKGINGKIMDALIAWSKRRGVTTFVLTVYPDNPGAISAYEKRGFKPALIEMRLRN